MLRAVVFDMDGLMFNTEDVYTLAATELLRRRGHVFTPELKDAMMGLQARPSIEVMIQYCGLTDDWHPLAVETAGLFIHFLSGTLSPMPGLMDLLDALERSGIPKAIGTSSSLQLVEPCLEPFGLKPRFQFILTAEDITRSKPDPEIYRTAAERFGLSPTEMMVLEDSENGCRAAAGAGAYAVAVPGEHSKKQDFGTASLVINTLADPLLYQALGIV